MSKTTIAPETTDTVVIENEEIQEETINPLAMMKNVVTDKKFIFAAIGTVAAGALLAFATRKKSSEEETNTED